MNIIKQENQGFVCPLVQEVDVVYKSDYCAKSKKRNSLPVYVVDPLSSGEALHPVYG